MEPQAAQVATFAAPDHHHAGLALALRGRLRRQLGFGLRLPERLYLAGFLPLELLCSLVLPLAAPQLPFLPLLCTSVYCAAGVHYAFALSLAFWWRTDEEAAAAEGERGGGGAGGERAVAKRE